MPKTPPEPAPLPDGPSPPAQNADEALRRRLRTQAARLPMRPGVYRMLDAAGQVLYVGKAGQLRRRVSSYFSKQPGSPRIGVMVSQVQEIEVTVTASEGAALLLENNLIKSLKPRYNVMLRDDKSYPYIYLSTEDAYPRLGFHRGPRNAPGRYFGPYPGAGAVRETLGLLQKLFPVRQCDEHYFRSRSRPCLQYQMRRCTAPCVGLVSEQDYGADVRSVELFLEGRDQEVAEVIGQRMTAAAQALDFERAALLRDQVASLRRVSESRSIDGTQADLDVIACAGGAGLVCVQVVFIRAGRNLGDRAFFPRLGAEDDIPTVLGAFLGQYYLDGTAPPELVLGDQPVDRELLEEALGLSAGRRVRFSHSVRGDRARWLEHARDNARLALSRRLAGRASLQARFEALRLALGTPQAPQRIECFDISHTQGEATVASCVVFDVEGAVKSDYRRFNISGITPGDDYAAMAQALLRRFRRAARGEGKVPDLLLIDGGRGQLAQVRPVLEGLGLKGITVLGVAKGETRRAGAETLILEGGAGVIDLPPDSLALHLIQQVRDEAHRFAITGHRARRGRVRQKSTLEDIPGMGPRRRQALLTHFGGLQALRRAGVNDIAQVAGISLTLAQVIYEALHGESV